MLCFYAPYECINHIAQKIITINDFNSKTAVVVAVYSLYFYDDDTLLAVEDVLFVNVVVVV